MTHPDPLNSAEAKTNGLRTAFSKRLASQFPRRHYWLAKTQLEMRKIWHTVTKDKWQRIADELADVLLQGWDKKTTEAINEAIGKLQKPGDFGETHLNQLISDLRTKLGPQFADDVAKPLQEIQTNAYRQGMEDVLEVKPSFKLIDRQAIDWLEENHMYWVRGYYDRQFQEQIAEAGQEVIRQGLSRRDAAEFFQEMLGDQVSSQSFRYWEGFANHVTTRSREFGRVEGYVRAGVTEIEIDAILDHRTSAICRHMNGRVIKVEDAVALRDKMMNAKSPGEVIEIAPFMKPDDVLGTSTAALKDDSPGFALPPYHYDCRTRTRKARTVSERNTVTEREYGKDLGDDKQLLSDLTDREYSNNIEVIRSRSQLSYSRNDFDADWKKHGSEFPDIKTKKEYRLAANRNLKAADRVQAIIHDGEKKYRFFGPNGITYVDSGAQIRCFVNPGDTDKAFDGMKDNALWLKTNSGEK